jgi:RHS repeat-associated protein
VYRDGLNPVAQLDAAGRLTQVYVYATRQHTPDYMIGLTWPADSTVTAPTGTTLYRLVSDVRGSVRLVVDATTGIVAQQLTYDPYGQVLDDTNPGFQPFGYAGGEYDWTTGLTRFGARDYDATIGRWTAKDPIGFGGGDTNLYAYVGGEPINSVDVDGLCPQAVAAVIPIGPAVAAAAGMVCLLSPSCLDALGDILGGLADSIAQATRPRSLHPWLRPQGALPVDAPTEGAGQADPEGEGDPCATGYAYCSSRPPTRRRASATRCGRCHTFCQGQGYWPARLPNGESCY